MEYYVGIDLHKRSFTYHAEDKEGTVLARGKADNSIGNLNTMLAQFPQKPKVVVEATINWDWLVDHLKTNEYEVTLAHPFKTRAIASAKIKTDSIDAKTLCQLLRAGLVPAAYTATAKEREYREIARARISLVHDRTLLKNRIHSLLTKENLIFKGTDLFGVSGRVWIEQQTLTEGKRVVIDQYLAQIDEVDKRIEELEKVIKKESGNLPACRILESIPGIGTITAFLLASEIGDITRFETAKQFASYFGLVPRLSQSGDHAYYGRITKLGNPYVRWALVQASHRLVRYDSNAQKFTSRVRGRAGGKKAIVAQARKLATIIYACLRDNREYAKDYTRATRSRPAIIPEKQTAVAAL